MPNLLSLALWLCCLIGCLAKQCGENSTQQVDQIQRAFVTSTYEDAIKPYWVPSYPSGALPQMYFYIVNCSDCGLETVNTTLTNHRLDGLTPASMYSVYIQAGTTDCDLSEPYQLVARTQPNAVSASSALYSETDKSITVRWTASATANVTYRLTCRYPGSGTSYDVVTENQWATCNELGSGEPYELTLTVLKDEFPSSSTKLQLRMTLPSISDNPADYTVLLNYAQLIDSSSVLNLKLNWTHSAIGQYDKLIATVASELDAGLNITQISATFDNELSINSSLLFSQRLRLSVKSKANSFNLVRYSREYVIFEHLVTPPDMPLVRLTASKRAVQATLTATSSSGVLLATVSGDGAPLQLRCSPQNGDSSCTVSFQSLVPFTEYRLDAFAEFQAVKSLPRRASVRTLEDVPSQPQNVTLRLLTQSDRAMTEWLPPAEPNGVIRKYTIVWGTLDFQSGSELPSGSMEITDVSQTGLELPQPLLPGREYFCRVSACTDAGCGANSDRAELLVDDGLSCAVSSLKQIDSDGSVQLDWQSVSLSEGRGVVFMFVVQLSAPPQSDCAVAQLVSCSDCRRYRDQMTPEGRSGLESLTSRCSDAQAGGEFDIGDSRVSAHFASLAAQSPWTLFSASVWPVNRAGPGLNRSIEFRTPETRSGPVRNLTVGVDARAASATVEFLKPESSNGLLMAYAIQVFEQGSECSRLLILNLTSAACQLSGCQTSQIIGQLALDCRSNLQSLAVEPIDSGDWLKAELRQMSLKVNLTVRVTPISQTLLGQPDERLLKAFNDSGNDSSVNILAIAVPSAIAVLATVVAAIFVLYVVRKRRIQNQSGDRDTSAIIAPSGAAESVSVI